MCSGSDAGSYLRLIDFVYQSTLSLRVIKKKKSLRVEVQRSGLGLWSGVWGCGQGSGSWESSTALFSALE